MKRSTHSVLPANNRPRGWIAAFPFVAAIVALGGIYAATAGRLPVRLATHFGADGRADGYSSAQGFLTLCLVMLLVFGTAVVVCVQRRVPAQGGRWLTTAGYATAAAIGYLDALTLLANVDAGDTTGASAVRLPLWQLAVTAGVAGAAGGAGWLLAGAEPPADRPAPGAAPRLDLPAGMTAGWSRTVSSTPLAIVGVLTLCAGVVIGALADWFGGAVLVLGSILIILPASVRVTVDRRGLTLAPTLVPFRLLRIPLGRLAEVTSRRISVGKEFGGWGYRLRPGGSGLLLRSGDGIVLRLTSGREFVVTVDDAATAAAVLNTYLDRARSPQGG
ncbi:DUF1648 domain-containing protein [Streptomyces sp. CT34]|uniref:DUF1648 domain-containing protein n=1 Tax=Streptomyces sp. CT34 TaxID=1553907 RepID=UPI0006909D7B|nr:DUF1648 domain-containing protein [Streptomyces sp. CT34]